MKNLFFIIILLPVLASCQNTKKNTKDIKLATAQDSVSYALGINIGESLKQQGINELNTDLISAAINQAFAGDTTVMLMNNQKAIAFLNTYFQKKQKEEGEKKLAEGKKFLEENAKNPNVKTTASGLQYEVISEGTGATPVDGDMITVNYTGKLIDGTIFDSSADHGQPLTRSINGVIKGWTEAFKLMKEGAKYKLYVPSELAYGPQGGGKIPPNSVLIFDVELIKVSPAPPKDAKGQTTPQNH